MSPYSIYKLAPQGTSNKLCCGALAKCHNSGSVNQPEMSRFPNKTTKSVALLPHIIQKDLSTTLITDFALDPLISSRFAWLQLTPNVSCSQDTKAGDESHSDGSEHDYDDQSDSDTYTWTGLEFTPWAAHSYIDSDGRMDLYSLRQIREAGLYAHGALPRCDWWYWDDPDQYPESDGPLLVLRTPEGDEFDLDDPKEYDGSYADESRADGNDCEMQTGGDEGSDTGYAFDATKGIMWADDEAEDDYWERLEGQGEEWWA
ncbi:hypothetical protein QBC40DRAFT_251636 [Triangularia verruculosa]|uniref:Uncharacterized protein n=1 Tax=Triangularia verruculosa TaxID=2587418 RepID=A0AAN6XM60_9PEZI|nr:hypothetical protein QBC40DRAFT_251636 [Triangularia verruculosa]